MSYIPLEALRNRGWHTDYLPIGRRMRYQAPCVGVSDDGHALVYDCATSSSTPSPLVPVSPSDACGRPFRPGPNFVMETASGEGVTCGGRPRR